MSRRRASSSISASRLNSDPNSPNDERGLLGMAFHPNYPTDPRVYLFYTGTDPTLGLVDRVSEFRTLDGGDTLSRRHRDGAVQRR